MLTATLSASPFHPRMSEAAVCEHTRSAARHDTGRLLLKRVIKPLLGVEGQLATHRQALR